MTAAGGPVVLIVRDVGLRSLLAAHLGIAGEAVVSGTFGEPAIMAAVAGAKLVLIDEATLRGLSPLWPVLSEMLPLSRTVVLGTLGLGEADLPAYVAQLSRIDLDDPRSAAACVLARLGHRRD